MTFFAPFAWGLLALGGPVVALYLLKTRLRRRSVTTLLFWDQLRPPVYNASLWRKLRRWLSLLLQLLFLALLAFALARPLAGWESVGRRATVIVLDPSPSMLATDVLPSRWTQAWEEARRRVDAMRFNDQAALILAEQPPRVLSAWTGSPRALSAALDAARQAPARWGGEGITEALAMAHRLAGARTDGKVVLLSDGAWSQPPGPAALADVETVYFGTQEPVNSGLTSFAARRSLAAPGDYLVAAEVRRFGAGAVDGELEIRRDGHLMDLQPLHLEPGKPWRKTWSGHGEEASTFQAHLRTFASGIAPTGTERPPALDQLAADNDAEARLETVAPVRVEIVAPPNGFLDAAVAALPLVQGHRQMPGEPTPDLPAALTIFYRTNPPESFPGAALLIDPPDSGFWGERAGTLDHPLVSDEEKNSVPLRFAGMEGVSLQAAREFRPVAGAEVFARSFDRPLVFGHWPDAADGGSRQDRRWLVLAFDLENTDFALRTAFPVLLGNLVQSLRAAVPVAATRPLPGEVKSRLRRTAPVLQPSAASGRPVAASVAARWAWAPLWWWAALLAAAWLLAEWWLFSRRITE